MEKLPLNEAKLCEAQQILLFSAVGDTIVGLVITQFNDIHEYNSCVLRICSFHRSMASLWILCDFDVLHYMAYL